MSHCVVVVEVAGIQEYIFSTNKLREQIGASYLVRQATEHWIAETLQDLTLPPTTVLYAGGGKTTLLLDADQARPFTRAITTRVLRDAPGLRMYAAHSDVFLCRPDGNDLRGHVLTTQQRLAAARLGPQSAPLLGLGVTAACSSTGLVAIGMSKDVIKDPTIEENYLISREVACKLAAADAATRALRTDIFPDLDAARFFIPLDFDQFGRSADDQSYIAVVHVDGNSIGQRFRTCGAGLTNDAYIRAIRTLSHDVETVGRQTLRRIGALLTRSLTFDETSGQWSVSGPNGSLPLSDNRFLPFRPLVYGGDDVTFVCDGRLGLNLATSFLRIFEEESARTAPPDKDEHAQTERLGQAYACAGIAIVKTHYPFARAYTLCEQLCDSAKQFSTVYDKQISALDWHLAPSGLLGDLATIRQREYHNPTLPQAGGVPNNLTIRPVALRRPAQPPTWRTWDNVARLVAAFSGQAEPDTDHDNAWAGRRNKVMALHETLRAGEAQTRLLLQALGNSRLPAYQDAPAALQTSGWADGRCGYFDPIELLDFSLALEEASDA